ncbi:MAG: VOC family protein, partial [Anaerolineales bacterium]|nr:VOC family protein [Anaerolineales bacterium]
MNSLSIDHVILVVSDLLVASQQFSQLGFTVIPGGVHSGGLTHNALVPFPDGTYLELLSTTRSSRLKLLSFMKRLRLLGFYIGDDTAINRRLTTDLAGGIGIADFCMVSGDLEKEINLLETRGAQFSAPIPGGRQRPDGKEISWLTSVPRTLDLPFLIEDATPRELRLPVVEDDYHKNGILGIGGLAILVSNLVESLAHYRALLGE